MLTLKRTSGQSIFIQLGDVLVKVMAVKLDSNGVYLGIDAPPEVLVDREEIYYRRLSEEKKP